MSVLASRKKEINITEGPIFSGMMRYAIPIMLTNVLQSLYNSADMWVIGNFCHDESAFGAISCTSSMINLILGLFIGLGAGVCVTLSHNIGSRDDGKISKTVHTAVLLALILGVAVSVLGIFIAPTLLALMNTRESFMAGAVLYVRIYFMGAVSNIMYNFCAGMLRSRGDTVRPMLFSMAGGVTNVLLNLFFVVVCKMSVEGVAIATITAQTISAALSLWHLMGLKDSCRLVISKLAIDRSILIKLVKIGLPAGIQGCMFSLSNVILQSGYNSLSDIAVNANAAANNVDAYLYNILNAFYHVTLTFASQSYGARKTKRLKKVLVYACVVCTILGTFLGLLSYIFSDQLVGIFNSDPNVLKEARNRLLFVGAPYFLCGLMEIGTAMLRSIGYSSISTVITFVGSCLFRIVWVFNVFPMYNTLPMLYIVYPLSWGFTFVMLTVAYVICYKRNQRHMAMMLKPTSD